jgi:hypothetical protein
MPATPTTRPGPSLTASLAVRVGDLADSTGVTPARLVGGAATALLVAAAAAWALRPPPSPVELDLPYVTTTTEPAVAEPAAAGPGAPRVPRAGRRPAVLVVHVAGAVADPGVHRLDAGARVVDAVAAAGGPRPGRRRRPGEPGCARRRRRARLRAPPGGGPPTRAGDARRAALRWDRCGGGDPVDLNRATATDLEALPGRGPGHGRGHPRAPQPDRGVHLGGAAHRGARHRPGQARAAPAPSSGSDP